MNRSGDGDRLNVERITGLPPGYNPPTRDEGRQILLLQAAIRRESSPGSGDFRTWIMVRLRCAGRDGEACQEVSVLGASLSEPTRPLPNRVTSVRPTKAGTSPVTPSFRGRPMRTISLPAHCSLWERDSNGLTSGRFPKGNVTLRAVSEGQHVILHFRASENI